MQAHLRRDTAGRPMGGLLSISGAGSCPEPVFYTLQRLTDGKYLTADALWRSGKSQLRGEVHSRTEDALVLSLGRDILSELDEKTDYRMSLGSGPSFPLTLEQDLLRPDGDADAPVVTGAESGREESGGRRLPGWLGGLAWGLAVAAGALLLLHVSQPGPVQLVSKPVSSAESGQTVVLVTAGESGTKKARAKVRQEEPAKPAAGAHRAAGRDGEAAGGQGGEEAWARKLHRSFQSSQAPASSVGQARRFLGPDADPRERDEAFLLLQDAAEKGNTEAMYLLAQLYDPLSSVPHDGVSADPLLAREWYRRAEASGVRHAGLAARALESYLEQLALQGDDEAQRALRSW